MKRKFGPDWNDNEDLIKAKERNRRNNLIFYEKESTRNSGLDGSTNAS
jgi:hypothetical protein